MSKEITRAHQFRHIKTMSIDDQHLTLNPEQQQELASLYEGALSTLKQGKIIVGKVIKADNDGVLVDIGYKSDGLIPAYEFSEHEIKKFAPGTEIEVILDELENVDGN